MTIDELYQLKKLYNDFMKLDKIRDQFLEGRPIRVTFSDGVSVDLFNDNEMYDGIEKVFEDEHGKLKDKIDDL